MTVAEARVLPATRLPRLRELLHPTDAAYCAEPLDIEDARWLLAQLDIAMELLRASEECDEASRAR